VARRAMRLTASVRGTPFFSKARTCLVARASSHGARLARPCAFSAPAITSVNSPAARLFEMLAHLGQRPAAKFLKHLGQFARGAQARGPDLFRSCSVSRMRCGASTQSA